MDGDRNASSDAQTSFDSLQSGKDEVLQRFKSTPAFRGMDADTNSQRVAQAMADQMSMPMTVSEVIVSGATNIRRGFLDPIINPLLCDRPNAPATVGQLAAALQNTTSNLSALQILREPPNVYLSRADQVDPSTSPSDMKVSIGLRELPRFKLQTGTDVGNGEGSAYGSLLWRNMFGGAEMLTLNAQTGTRTRSAYSANLSAPVLSDSSMRISLEGRASAVDKPWASHEEVIKGGSLRFSWLNAQRDAHTLEYLGAWRQITGLSGNASPTMRQDAGDSIKSAIKHTFYRERRDNIHLPQDGYMLRSAFELAGVGPLSGDVAFSKSEFEVGGAVPIPWPGTEKRTGMSIGGGFRFGMLWPLPVGFNFGGNASASRINDRFLLGGPTDVRGFKMGGLGPHDGRDAVGGDLYTAGSINMLLPFPYKGPDSSLRFQLFASGGRLVALQGGSPAEQNPSSALTPRAVGRGMLDAMRQLAGGLPSVAAGAGLVYAHPVARFELNVSFPFVLRQGEVGTKGIQVGVGINFL